MPAKSQAQRAYLNAKFGHAWVKAHHFDNKGKLPAHVGQKKGKAMKKKHKGKAHHHPHHHHGHVSHGRDKHAHASHHANNRAHGTPNGFHTGTQHEMGKHSSNEKCY